jgi:hypothetical protein
MSADFATVAWSEPMAATGGRMEGGTPLPGGPGLISLLVRETVQNAWDARDDERGEAPVFYEAHGHDFADVALLRRLLPVEDLGGFARERNPAGGTGLIHPWSLLTRDSVRLLVISDRNTVGLCGPTRAGHAWEPVRHGKPLARGQQRFANFVRNTGRAVENIGRGDGGAYGVGKSSLWMASLCGTILIHTRTTDEEGKPVERLMGSVHGTYFKDADRREYSGRHFVGQMADDGVIEPMSDDFAQEARRRLPIPEYEYDGEQTYGTSIIIVAPRFMLDLQTEMERCRDAIRWHVWPKRVPGARGAGTRPDMDIRVLWNKNQLLLPSPLDDVEIHPYAQALQHCAVGANAASPPPGATDLTVSRDFEVMCGKPRKHLGNLKIREVVAPSENVFQYTLTASDLQRRFKEAGGSDDECDAESAIDLERPWGHVALIRREPLLLVKYMAIAGLEPSASEVGVFLSSADSEVEDALTRSEPPAHDDWDVRNVPTAGGSDHRKTYVRRTLQEIKSSMTAFVTSARPHRDSVSGTGHRKFAAEFARGIYTGFGGWGGTKEDPPIKPPGGRSSKRASTKLELVRSDERNGVTSHEIRVRLQDPTVNSGRLKLKAAAKAYDVVGSMKADDLIEFRWLRSDGSSSVGSELEADWRSGDSFTLIITVERSLRIRPSVALLEGPAP